jgi:transposase
MSRKRFAEKFKIEAVRQTTERGFAALDVAERLGVSANSLDAWIKQFGIPAEKRVRLQDQGAETRRLQVTSNHSARRLMSTHLTKPGSLTSPILVHTRDGSIWRLL